MAIRGSGFGDPSNPIGVLCRRKASGVRFESRSSVESKLRGVTRPERRFELRRGAGATSYYRCPLCRSSRLGVTVPTRCGTAAGESREAFTKGIALHSRLLAMGAKVGWGSVGRRPVGWEHPPRAIRW